MKVRSAQSLMKIPIFLIDDYYKKGLISPKVRNGLLRSNIKNISQLFNLNESEIKNLRGFGEATIAELENLIETLKNETDFNVKASNELKSQFSKKVSFLKSYLLKDLNFSLRTKNCLEKENINSLYDLVNCSLNDLKKIKDFGANCADEIVQFLNKNNLSLGYDLDAIESKALSDLRIFDFPQEILNLEIILKPEIPPLSEREKEILNLRNEKMLTLEEIGKKIGVTRERIRQILAKLQRKGFEISDHSQRKEKKLEKRRKEIMKLSKTFIELYENKNLQRSLISKKLKISITEINWLEKKLIDQNKINKRLVDGKRARKILPEIQNRRNMILKFKAKKMTIDEISLQLGVSKPTVMNDIRKMKLSGIDVPYTRKSGGSLSEEEIEFRKDFIQDKINEGWSKKQISDALGFDVHQFIRRHMFLDN
jgi:RNA polymerase sigma factor (sigma-70 family)